MDEVRGGLYIGMEAYGERKQETSETVMDKTCGMSELAYLIRIQSGQIFEYLDYYQKEEGYLLSFNFNKNKETGIKKIEYKGKHIIETVV